MIFKGKTLLGYSEDEIWEMTVAKYDALYKEYMTYNGITTVEKRETIDDAFPF